MTRALAIFLLFCVAMAACSGTSEPDATEPPATAQPTVAPQADPTPAPAATIPPTAIPTEVPAEPEPAWAVGDSSYLFDQDELRTYEITISEENLKIIDDDPTAEQYVEASLSFEGTEVGKVGLRYKGSVGAFVGCVDGPLFAPSGEKTCTKLSMKMKINWAEGSETTFYGQKRLQFHAMNGDASVMRERMGYYLFAAMGVPTPRAVHARVVVNGELVGLFALIEQIDGRFARQNFENGKGNVYKELWPLTAVGSSAGETAMVASLRTNEDDDDLSIAIMESFADALAAADPADVPALLEQYMDVDEAIAYWVVDRTIRHDDGPFHWYCLGGGDAGCNPHNFYWYEDPVNETLHLIPWDLDYAFENIGGDSNPVTPVRDGWGEISENCETFVHGGFGLRQRSATCDKLVAGLVTFDDLYQQKLADFLAGPLAPDNVNQLLEQWTTQVEPVIVEANELHNDALDPAGWERALGRFRSQLSTAAEG